ncbi:NUAK SNF1-like kinase 1 [Mactra antiquata]
MKSIPARAMCDMDMEAIIPDELIAGLGHNLLPEHKHNLKNRFELKKTLGEGTYGKVKLAVERSSGKQFAIKYIRKSKIHDEHDLNRIRREIKIMSSLNHPHIIKVNEVFENKDKIILVMECADGGELYDYINNNNLTEKDARRIFRQIVSAIQYCHRLGIVHRDLKLENILLDRDNNAKIADFGLSNYYNYSDKLKTFCGSPLYASPEIVSGQPYYGPEVDCWSLGVVLYTLVYGTMPFDGSNFKRLRTQITTGDYYEPDKPSESAGLIRHLLTVNPAKRANIGDILCHWWVNLGHNTMPDNEPYIPPMVLQPVSSYHNQTLSSSSESDDGETEASVKTVKPLKGILKKPKMTDNISEKKCNVSRKQTTDTSCIVDDIDNENSDNLVFSDNISNQTGSETNVSDEIVTQSNQSSNDSNNISATGDESNNKKVFDAQVMPKRGILKRKGKFSSGDSGCDLNELNKKDSAGLSVRQMDLSEPDSAIDSPGFATLDVNINQSKTICDNISDTFSFDRHGDRNIGSVQVDNVPVTVVPRRKGILKNHNSDKRLSACSTGSNSSADFLDFSYDSCDELLDTNCRKTSSQYGKDYSLELRDVRVQGQAALQHQSFDYLEARDMCQQAQSLLKDS